MGRIIDIDIVLRRLRHHVVCEAAFESDERISGGRLQQIVTTVLANAHDRLYASDRTLTGVEAALQETFDELDDLLHLAARAAASS
jgi:hypothetical protein